ncbi:MAG TPA: DUF4252 domain-containing protein [Lacunisphaera sp.]|jgi:hypothetical protein|nr:DUF4252 domain-containing protein [Lacunisphaera sp.]
MKYLRSLLVAGGLSVALSTFASAAETGAIDIGQLMPSAKGQFVEVNLSHSMLQFAAKLTAHQEPETAELIRNLKSIRVNVVGMDDSNRAATVEKIESVRQKLEAQGWTKMVMVRDEAGGDNVNIHVLQHDEENIDGLVVTVIDRKGEAVFVNIVGNINADQIAKIADKFDIEPLKKMHLKFSHGHKDKEV